MSCAVSLQVSAKSVPFEARADFASQFDVRALVQVAAPGGLQNATVPGFCRVMDRLKSVVPKPEDGVQRESVTIFLHYLLEEEPREILEAGPESLRDDPRIEAIIKTVIRVSRYLDNVAIHYVGVAHYLGPGPMGNKIWHSLYVIDSFGDYGIVRSEEFYRSAV